MKKLLGTAVGVATLAVPFFALAAATAAGMLRVFGNLIQIATPIVVALALLAFFWGLAVFIFNTSDEKKRKGGLQIMIWGIIALFVMVSVWGIINVLQNTFSVGDRAVNVPIVNSNPYNPFGN